MNPAALLGLAAVGLGLWFATSKSGGGSGESPKPQPIPPGPGPSPVKDCSKLEDAVADAANLYSGLYEKDAGQTGDLCNAWANLREAVKASEEAGCTVQDLSDLTPPVGCGGGYVPPGTNCEAELATFRTADEAARAAVANWAMNTLSSADACKFVQARELAASAVAQKGCEIPESDFDDRNVCDINPACEAGAAALAQWSALAAQGQIDAACAGLAAAQAAYDSMAAADCDMRNWFRPELECGGGGGVEPNPADPCAVARAALEWRRDQPWPTDQAGKCAEINRFNALVLEYSQKCGNPEGWTYLDTSECGAGGCAALVADMEKWGSYFSALVAEGRIDEACQAQPEYNKRFDAVANAGCSTGNRARGSLQCGGAVQGLKGAIDWARLTGGQGLPRW